MHGRACCSVAPASRQNGAPVTSKPSSSLLGVKVAMWYARSRSTRGGTVTSSPRCGVLGLGDADDMAISTRANLQVHGGHCTAQARGSELQTETLQMRTRAGERGAKCRTSRSIASLVPLRRRSCCSRARALRRLRRAGPGWRKEARYAARRSRLLWCSRLRLRLRLRLLRRP